MWNVRARVMIGKRAQMGRPRSCLNIRRKHTLSVTHIYAHAHIHTHAHKHTNFDCKCTQVVGAGAGPRAVWSCVCMPNVHKTLKDGHTHGSVLFSLKYDSPNQKQKPNWVPTMEKTRNTRREGVLVCLYTPSLLVQCRCVVYVLWMSLPARICVCVAGLGCTGCACPNFERQATAARGPHPSFRPTKWSDRSCRWSSVDDRKRNCLRLYIVLVSCLKNY